MANWNQNPDWNPIALINKGMVIESADGFTAADQVKIIENIQFLFNTGGVAVYVGNVTTTTGAAGTNATVKVTPRIVTGTGMYLDFEFTVPRGATGATGSAGAAAGFGTPTATATGLASGAQPTVSITASGTNTSKVFAFNFGIPKGDVGPQGPKGDTGGLVYEHHISMFQGTTAAIFVKVLRNVATPFTIGTFTKYLEQYFFLNEPVETYHRHYVLSATGYLGSTTQVVGMYADAITNYGPMVKTATGGNIQLGLESWSFLSRVIKIN